MDLPESRPGWTPLYCLSGPTASGKSDLAHRAVEQMGGRILSADSMMVYRGMDIGTAKPTPREQIRYDYAGLDRVNPGDPFSTGAWLRAVAEQLDDRPTVVVGGTGLYFRALLEGLTPGENLPDIDPALTVSALRAEICALDPQALGRLADPQNPRRLARALQWLRAGKPLPDHWQHAKNRPRIPVLTWPVEALNVRIRLRAEAMFTEGLLAEAEALRDAYGSNLGTAAQAIGYREAFAVLEGTLTRDAAVEAITLRTRRYAKRQRTWFRNQMNPAWLDGNRSDLLEALLSCWQNSGPFWHKRQEPHRY